MIKKVAILGVGHYGEILLNVLVSPQEKARGIEVVGSHRRAERREELEEKYGIPVLASNIEACKGADMIYPLVRPEQTEALMQEIGHHITDNQIVAMGAASLRLPFYRRHLPSRCSLAWVFPTPFISLRAGFLAIHAEPSTDPRQLAALEEYWGRFCDKVIFISEEAMDTFVILHACGQFYMYPMLKAMIRFGQNHGFTPEQTRAIVLSTMVSAARALSRVKATPEWLEETMDRGASPGSLTGAGVAVLREEGVEEIYDRVMQAALAQAQKHRDA